jgi:hypothetical protein
MSISATIANLVGLTLIDAQSTVVAHGMRSVFEPAGAGVDWVVTSQRPAAAGERFRFNATIAMLLIAPTTGPVPPTETPVDRTVDDRTLDDSGTVFTPVAIATGGGIGLLLLLLAVLGVRAVRRARRAEVAPTEIVEMRISAGSVSGPTVVEPPGAISLSVRLESHMDVGTQTVQEVAR